MSSPQLHHRKGNRALEFVRLLHRDQIHHYCIAQLLLALLLHKYLDLENPNKICFISGKVIQNLSVDHVIPWSYLYSDDLWNLVYVEKGVNSSKSNTIPSEELINKLIDRNQELMEIMVQNGYQDKQKEELDLSIKRDYVKQFWIGCKG